jgi:predicted nucleotidyltransferase
MISLRSKVSQKLLGYFFLNPERNHYVNELSQILELDKRNLVKKLKELESEGLLSGTSRGNLKFYSLNKKFRLFKEYRNIVLATVGLEKRLGELIRDVPGVKEAYLFGSFAARKQKAHSDIDLLVIGSHDLLALQRKIIPFQNKTGREVNIVNMDEEEFHKRKANRDPFLAQVFSGELKELICGK